MNSNASYHFAIALLRSARKTGELKRVDQDLGAITSILAGDRRVAYFLLHPLVPAARKDEFLGLVAGSEIVRRLMKVLLATKNLNLTSEVYARFSALVRDELGIVRASMKVADPLGKADEERLRKALERSTGKEVDLEVTVDPNILAGVWMRVGDTVIDNTLKSELKMVRERLVSG